jgi:methyl-accepting chemotaxis protein
MLTFVIVRTINHSIKDMIKNLNLISEGDFTATINITNKSDFGMMKKSLSDMMGKIAAMLKLVKENCDNIALDYIQLSEVSQTMNETSGEVAAAIQEVSTGSLSQSENLSCIDISVTRLGNELENILTFMQEVSGSTQKAGNRASEGNNGLNQLMDMIQGIDNSFEEVNGKILNLSRKVSEVNHITNLINSIADQTNMLALNASIEAARAGVAGRGFSVVADEVRTLSEQAKGASQKIHLLLGEISTETDSVVNTTEVVSKKLDTQFKGLNHTIYSFKEIINAIESILPKINNASQLILDLNGNKNYVIEKVKETNVVSQENAALSQQISASSQEMHNASGEVASTIKKLEEMTNKVRSQVDLFKL